MFTKKGQNWDVWGNKTASAPGNEAMKYEESLKSKKSPFMQEELASKC